MNIRKIIDYSEMYEILDMLMAQQLSQMELYCEIGKAVSQRSEKGAAVAASEYLSEQYPDVQGFSPRNLRRMRDFYRAYEGHPAVLLLALQLGWTQNVVILEADLSMELRRWYLLAACRFGWSKAELKEKIDSKAHEVIVLDTDEEGHIIVEKEEVICQHRIGGSFHRKNRIRYLIRKVRYRMKSIGGNRRRNPVMSCPIFTVKRIIDTQNIRYYALGGMMTKVVD